MIWLNDEAFSGVAWSAWRVCTGALRQLLCSSVEQVAAEELAEELAEEV